MTGAPEAATAKRAPVFLEAEGRAVHVPTRNDIAFKVALIQAVIEALARAWPQPHEAREGRAAMPAFA